MLQLSHLKLLAGVFFALFVLTACGGSDAAAPAEAAATDTGTGTDGGSDTRSCTDAQFDNGTDCVAKVTADKCNGDGYNGVDAATNTCIAYTQATCESASKFWDGTNCVAKVTSCTDQYLDVANNKCIAYTSETCTEFFNSSNQCVAVIDPGTCGSNQLVEANVCTDYTSATCPASKFWDSSANDCVVKVTSCNNAAKPNLDAANNQCISDTQASCQAEGKFWDSSASSCVAKVTSCTNANQHVVNNVCTDYTSETCTEFFNSSNQCVAVIDPSTCGSNQHVVDNVCTNYSSETCLADGKFFDSTDTCVAKISESDCMTMGYKGVNASTNICTNPYVATEAGFYTNAEYTQSGALAGIKAAEAYANIATLIAADTTGTIKQGGEGQTVSIVKGGTGFNFNTNHQEFANAADSLYSTAFSSIYNASSDTLYEGDDITTGAGKCTSAFSCDGGSAGLIAARKGGYAPADDPDGKQMHGIAYNAQLKGISTSYTSSSDFVTHLLNAIPAGVGADIIAMNHVWYDETTIACYADGGIHRTYRRPKGANRVQHNYINVGSDSDKTNDTCTGGTTSNDTISDDELTAWQDAVGNIGASDAIDGNTIMVFSTGSSYFNSENGLVFVNNADSSAYYILPSIATVTATGSVANANIPDYRAAYPALYDEDDEATSDINEDLTADRWLVVTGLNAAGTAILSNANGCGVAMNFCLAAPGGNIYTADNNGTEDDGYNSFSSSSIFSYASSTVAGALAVLKGAFPNAEPEQLTRLVLETSDYIELDNMTPTTTCTGVEGDLFIPIICTTTYAALADEETDNRRRVCKDTNGVVTIADAGANCPSGTTHAAHPNGTDMLYVNPVYGYGKLDMAEATKMSVIGSYVTASNNESIGVLWKDTQLTLSSHFGTGLDSVKLGIGDEYGRHFTVKANKITSAPVAVASLDEYMGNMLADNVQSEKLGGQAKLNYSNNGQPWMDLEYKAGKATSKIAFQDNYKVKPLHNNSAASILRANHIRPASNNIGMMDVDYALNGALSLSSYAARGEYDTGYKFDELGTDFDVNYKKSHLNIAIGNIREHDQFLGTHTTGGYALNAPTVSRFTDVTYGHDVGNRFNIYANYINYETDVDMLHDQFASIDNLQADQYQIGFTGKSLLSDDDNLNVALITKLGVTDGALNQNTTLGYTADGGFNDVSQSYDLAVSERHQQFEITYQGKIYQNSQDEVSVLKDNRFFTTIRVDQNLNHVQGVGQTEIVSGVSARF